MAQNSEVSEMVPEKDYRVKLKSKKMVIDQLEKYRELLKKLLDGQPAITEEVKQKMLQELLWDFDRGVQENILINGEPWDDVPNDGDDEADCKTLDDLLDENILETTLKRSNYPKKILPYVVRSLKAERELMGLYEQAVKPQEISKDPAQETIMTSLSEAAPRIIRQANTVMKSLQDLHQKAAGVSQVLSMRPTKESQQIHKEVFGRPDGEEEEPLIPSNTARSSQPLKRAVLEMGMSSAYVLPTKKPAPAENSEEALIQTVD
ncbi:hypothetical protein GJAV_G00117890 [Gymnothorax javanicus]|nr:hypothetical protein GJAV_G00117890 [Gymnothorax javanicus]